MLPLPSIARLYAPALPNRVDYAMPAAAYHASPGVSRSMLNALHPVPACFPHYVTHPKEASDAMNLGTLVHSRVLDKSLTVPAGWAVKPEGMSFATREGKFWKEDHANLTLLTQKQWDDAIGMTDAVARHPRASQFFAQGTPEVTAFARHESTRLLRRARIDWLPRGNVIADLKTCRSVEMRDFQKAIAEYGYHRQAYYLDVLAGAGITGYERLEFICVESEPPYNVACYLLGPESQAQARSELETDLQTLHRCCNANTWPGYPDGFTEIELPAWARTVL